MNVTYVKLYRKLLDNRQLWRDDTSLKVFIWLLLRVDYTTGKLETGRFVAAKDIGINPNTFYSSLKRLEKLKIINTKSNNKFSEISILNWHKYQSGDNTYVNNNSTTTQQQLNTIQEVKNKRIKEKREEASLSYLLSDNCYGKLYETFPLIEEKSIKNKCAEFTDYCTSNGKTYKDYLAAVRNAIRRDQDKLPKKAVIRPAPIYEPPEPELTEEEQAEKQRRTEESKQKIRELLGKSPIKSL